MPSACCQVIAQHRGDHSAAASQCDHAEWRAGDQRYYVSDTRRAAQELGLRPALPWREGLPRLADWLREEHASGHASRGGAMRVALVNPPWSFDDSIYFGCREPHLPLELGYCRALLEAAGHEVLLARRRISATWRHGASRRRRSRLSRRT